MKKLLAILFFMSLIFTFGFTTVSAATIEMEKYNALSYMKMENVYSWSDNISDIQIDHYEDLISGSLKQGNDYIIFKANKVNYDQKNQLTEYIGEASINKENYHVQITENENGFSSIVYSDSKEVITAFMIFKNSIETHGIKSEFDKKSQELAEQVSEIQIIEENESSQDMSPMSTYYDRTKYIYLDAFSIPFVISGGTVEGTLYYTKAVGDPDFNYYFNRLYGYINWESGFDGISIDNANAPYGGVWTTPTCPPKTITTWNINDYSNYGGSYYLTANVSYTILVKNLPVIFWLSDDALID